MDIHKPKAARSWREFLIEIGTIICGILIALGLEQGVEWLHWRHQVEAAEAAVAEEVRFNMLNEYERIMVRGCLSSRIAELRDRLLEPGTAWKGTSLAVNSAPSKNSAPTMTSLAESWAEGPMPQVYNAPFRLWPNGSWGAAVASGVPLHMRAASATFFGTLYREFESELDRQASEQQAITKLAPLAFDRHLSEAERAQYLSLLGQLDRTNSVMANSAAQVLLATDKAGLRISARQVADRIGELRKRPMYATCLEPLKIGLSPD